MDQSDETPEIADSFAFFVDDQPQVTWAWDLKERNLHFLQSIDPAYYRHVGASQTLALRTGGIQAQYAAASVRIAHAQAAETLFALLASLAQAPRCAIGWMLAYQNRDLRAVIGSLMSSEGLTATSAWEESITLEDLAELVFCRTGWPEEKLATTSEAFVHLWNLWSAEILDPGQISEYNSFKHGTRAGLGGHSVAIGKETTPGVPTLAEDMVSMGGSIFGSTFYVNTEVDGRLHRYPRRRSHNWSPAALVSGLDLLAMSIQNVVSILRILGGDDPQKCLFQIPESRAAFDLPFTPVGGVTSSSLDLNLGLANIERLTKSQVRQLLNPEP